MLGGETKICQPGAELGQYLEWLAQAQDPQGPALPQRSVELSGTS